MLQTPAQNNPDKDRSLPDKDLEFDHALTHVSELASKLKKASGNVAFSRRSFSHFIKRSFDLTLAATMLFMLSPLFITIALIVRRDGGPAFYGHRRVGLNGVFFDCYKFRSMYPDAEKILHEHLAHNPAAAREWLQYQKLKDDIRVTPFGSFLRRSSLDELPQLINVVKGDMSFVGPRPCTPEQEDFYAEDFSYYTSVRPGITGPWQVSGRNKLTFQQRVALESSYVRNWTLALDIRILLKTIPTVLRKDGAF